MFLCRSTFAGRHATNPPIEYTQTIRLEPHYNPSTANGKTLFFFSSFKFNAFIYCEANI